MKTAIADKKKKIIKVEQRNASIIEYVNQEKNEEPEDIIEVVQLSPSFLNMPYFKFFIAKNQKAK